MSKAASPEQVALYATVFTLLGALIGLVATPWVTTRPVGALRSRIRQMPAHQLVSGYFGLDAGPDYGAVVFLPAVTFARALSLYPAADRRVTVFLSWHCGDGDAPARYSSPARREPVACAAGMLLPRRPGATSDMCCSDTSVIIDGRIADVSQTGFICGHDAGAALCAERAAAHCRFADMLRRNRGRRGLDILNRLQKESVAPVRITDMDVEDVREVDDKLVMLAKQLRCPILTNDYNLNRVAELQGVMVLNINELANAVKAVFLPGETHAGQDHPGRQGGRPGRGLSGRWHDGRGRGWPPPHQPDARRRRDQGPADGCRADDLCQAGERKR